MAHVGVWRRLAFLVDDPDDDPLLPPAVRRVVHLRAGRVWPLGVSVLWRPWTYAGSLLGRRKPLSAPDTERARRTRRNPEGGIRGEEDRTAFRSLDFANKSSVSGQSR